MTTPAVCLHIGAMKTGTTYVQGMLEGNHEQLALAGILYPTPWTEQVSAVRDVLGLKGGGHLGTLDGRWRRLIDRLHEWDGPRALLSMEFLSFASPSQIRGVVDDLAPSEISVVLGARDLARVLPAQWQTAVRNRSRDTYRDYLKALTVKRPTRGKQHFWKRQDYGRIAQDWANVVGPANVTVVTVPPSGAEPGELWRRMAAAMHLELDTLEVPTPSNESLGPSGTELLRRINERVHSSDMNAFAYQHGINRAISHQVLPEITDQHPRLRVPDEYHPWVRQESDRMIAELRAADVQIIGDIADLEPRLDSSSGFVWPEEVPESDLLAFAVTALTAMGRDAARRKRKQMEADLRRRALSAEKRGQQQEAGTDHPRE